MASAQFTVPPSVPQNIARAKAALKQGDALKAARCLMSALELFDPKKVIGKAKYETGIFIMEVVEDLNRSPKVQDFLSKVGSSIPYTPGHESQLYAVLGVLVKSLQDDVEAAETDLVENRDERRNQLWARGIELLEKGEAARGKAILRRLSEEFGDEPGVNSKIGEALVNANLASEGVEYLEAAIRQAPSDHKPYGYLVRSYTELRDYENAEKVYIAVLKRFGQHYKTLINLATLYKLWNKREKAYDIAKMATRLDPGNQEAKEIMDWADRRR